MNFIGENQRLAASKKQIERFRRIAVDGKSGRVESEKRLAEWHVGAADRARDKQVYGEEVRAWQARKRLVRREGARLCRSKWRLAAVSR